MLITDADKEDKLKIHCDADADAEDILTKHCDADADYADAKEDLLSKQCLPSTGRH